MIGPGLPGSVMEAFSEGFACAQGGILTVTIDDGDGNNVLPQTTAGILEIECGDDGFAVYRYLGVYPSDASLSPYVITWEGASATDPNIDTTATEEIFVSDALIAVPSGEGPCTDWLTEEDVLACCDVEASSGIIFDSVIGQAQNLLYQLSGRKYAGLCGPLTVRPCRDNCSCFPAQRLAYASGGDRLIWTGGWWGWGDSTRNCGCGCLSQVKLSGYPVQIITEVKIDGEIVPPSSYRLDEHRYLTRVDGSYWPSCQDLALADTEEGTFSVSYGYGASPPPEGVAAAAQLACELYKVCLGADAGDCLLPTGATRITRQGITIERQFFQRDPMTNSWRTGLQLVDLFLNAYNPKGLLRRPTFWSPGRRYARPIG
jgi:hypothetical protein